MEGIVIKVLPYGEADLVITVLAKESGKVTLFARSARKSKRRFANPPDIFDHGNFQVKQGRGSLLAVDSFQSLGSFRRLREKLDKLTAASALCEAFDLLLPEQGHDPHTEVFSLLAGALQDLEFSPDCRAALKICFGSLASLLRRAGYTDELSFQQASALQLLKIVDRIEHITERRFQSRSALEALITELRKESAAEKV